MPHLHGALRLHTAFLQPPERPGQETRSPFNQKGAGACPRSPSKVKEYPEHLWRGRANIWRKDGEI